MTEIARAPRRRSRHPLVQLIPGGAIVQAAGAPAKTITEHVGRVNTGTDVLSIARMSSPAGWSEPWQTPDFDEWTLLLSGSLLVEHEDGRFLVTAGQAVHVPKGRRVRYSTPDGAEYTAVCVPAFSPEAVHRDLEQVAP